MHARKNSEGASKNIGDIEESLLSNFRSSLKMEKVKSIQINESAMGGNQKPFQSFKSQQLPKEHIGGIKNGSF